MRKALLAFAIIYPALAAEAAAQPYPSRPVTFIVPFGAGGPVDSVARILSDAMRASLGQPVIIENVTGASGTLGVTRAVRAAPDGYTVSIGNWPSHIVNGAIYTLPYDVRTDFEPVARLSSNPYVVVARKDLPATDLRELISLAQDQSRQGDPRHRRAGLRPTCERRLFQKVTATRFQFVPYRAGRRRSCAISSRDTSISRSIRPSPLCRMCATARSKLMQ